MRVVEVIAGLGRGGSERALLARLAFAGRNHKSLVLSTRPALTDLESEVEELSALRVLKLSPQTLHRLLRVIRSFRPDVVLVHNPMESLWLLALGSRLLQVPVIVVAHSDRVSFRPQFEWLIRAALRVMNRRAAGHIAVSQTAAEGDQCRGSRRVEVAHLGALVDVKAIPESPWPDGTKVRLLALGRFVTPKNFPSLVAAVARVALVMRSVQGNLVIAGFGPDEAAIRSAISKYGVTDLVTLRSDVKEPSGVLAAADLLVISSTHEGGPLTAYEAAQFGVPIIGTPVGVVPAVVAGDTASVLLSGSSVEELAEGLNAALERPILSSDARQRREIVGARWSTEACSKEFYGAVERILASR